MCRSFIVLIYDVCIILDISNQEMIIKKLINDNAKLYESLKMLKVVWLKKIVESEKMHLSLIIKIIVKTMMNQLLNISMLKSYQKCSCKLFKKNYHII